MKLVRITASILFYISGTAALFFLLTGLYGSLVLLFTRDGQTGKWPIHIENDHYILYYPFTTNPFLIGDHELFFVLTSFSVILLYGVFLWLLSKVFNAFRQERLFTKTNVYRLTQFYIFNLIIPILVLLVLIAIPKDIRNVIIICFLHMMIGVFVFFMTTIFKQGLVLQEEQDLTL